MRFSGQGTMHKYYLVASVTGTGALLSNTFTGTEGVQVSTTRHYGGRGTPLTSKIHCQLDENLCPSDAENQSGSLQNKLEDLTSTVQSGVFVDQMLNADNRFIWRVTFWK